MINKRNFSQQMIENRLRLMVACREYTYLDENNQATMKSYPIENWDDSIKYYNHTNKSALVFDALIGEEKMNVPMTIISGLIF